MTKRFRALKCPLSTSQNLSSNVPNAAPIRCRKGIPLNERLWPGGGR